MPEYVGVSVLNKKVVCYDIFTKEIGNMTINSVQHQSLLEYIDLVRMGENYSSIPRFNFNSTFLKHFKTFKKDDPNIEIYMSKLKLLNLLNN